ncbi:MAG: inositol monophosphatase family protein [Bacteriovoracia bacterium]
MPTPKPSPAHDRLTRDLEKTAITAARAAGEVLMRYFRKNLQVREKRGAGLVTQADLQAERTALKILLKQTPRFGVTAEESANRDSSPAVNEPEGRWYIDPLDGTTNFVHGFPFFCVSIGAAIEGELAVGVIYHPTFNDLYTARRGHGAFLNGKRIHVSRTRKLHDSLLTTGFTYRKDAWLKREMVAFERLSGIVRAIRRPGSAALDLAYVARGVFDGFWERRLSPWDVAAGALLVEEAGGRVTDFRARAFRPEQPEILASNSVLHRAMLREITAPSLRQ